MSEGKNEFGEEELKVSTESAKCSSCGANMVYDPERNALYCPHCGAERKFQDSSVAEERDFMSGLSADSQWKADETTVFRCDNCGAKVVLDKRETAKFCPFCGTAHVEKVDELAGLKPNGVLPFSFGAEKALEYSKAWARKRFFAPRKFKKHLESKNVSGVYAPCFTFDSSTYSVYRGRIGTTHTRTVGSGKNQRTETYVVWRNISGSYNFKFDDVLVASGSKIGQKEIEKIQPFDTNNAKVYQEKYLLGFMAYHYDRELSDCWVTAKEKMDKSIRSSILGKYSYDRVDYLNVSTSHERVTYKYGMIPVYVGNFTFKQKLFNFFVNGNTGKTWGKYPKSFWKILLVVLLGVAAAAGLVYLILSGS